MATLLLCVYWYLASLDSSLSLSPQKSCLYLLLAIGCSGFYYTNLSKYTFPRCINIPQQPPRNSLEIVTEVDRDLSFLSEPTGDLFVLIGSKIKLPESLGGAIWLPYPCRSGLLFWALGAVNWQSASQGWVSGTCWQPWPRHWSYSHSRAPPGVLRRQYLVPYPRVFRNIWISTCRTHMLSVLWGRANSRTG